MYLADAALDVPNITVIGSTWDAVNKIYKTRVLYKVDTKRDPLEINLAYPEGQNDFVRQVEAIMSKANIKPTVTQPEETLNLHVHGPEISEHPENS